MNAIIILGLTTVGGWLGWWLGAFVGTFTAFALSMIGTGAGLYFAKRLASRYRD